MPHQLKQTVYYALGLLIMKGISFVMIPMVTRFLNPTQYGTLDVLVTWMNLGSIVLGMGLVEALYKSVNDGSNRRQQQATVTTALLFHALLALGALAVLMVAFYTFGDALPAAISARQWTLASVTFTVGAIINIPLTWLRLIDNARLFFALTSGKALLQAAMTLLFLTLGYGVDGILLSGAVSTLLLAGVLVTMQLRRQPWAINWPVARQLFRYGSPLIVSGLLLFLSAGAEKWILAGLIDLDSLAYYAIAMQFALMVAFMMEPFTLWWFPKRLGLIQTPSGRARNAKYASLGCTLSFLLAMMLGMNGPILIDWLLPEHYASAGRLLPWLCLGIAFKQCSHTLNTGLYSGATTFIVTQLNAVMAMIALGLFVTLTVQFGLTGVVMAFVVIYLIRAVLFCWVSQRILNLPYHYTTIVTSAGVATLALALAPFSPSPVMTILFSVVVLAGFVVVYLKDEFFNTFRALQPKKVAA